MIIAVPVGGTVAILGATVHRARQWVARHSPTAGATRTGVIFATGAVVAGLAIAWWPGNATSDPCYRSDAQASVMSWPESPTATAKGTLRS